METTTKSPKIFYGWYLVGVSLISGAFQTGIGIWGVSVFVSPMEDELGWSRTSFMVALTIRTALTGLLSPFVGPWRDTKNGPRVLMLAGSIILGISLIALKYVDSLWQFYLFFGVFGSFGALGAGGILTQTILPKWFIRKRGFALGIASMGGGTGPLVFPIAILGLITWLGWRDAWLFLGVLALVLLVPLSFLVKTRPEDMGLHPDGVAEMPERGVQATADQPARRPGREFSFSGKQALGTPAFWLIIFAFALGGLGQQGFQANWIPYLEGEGFSTKTGAWAISVYGVCSVSARIIWGTLADKRSIRHLIVIQSLLTAISVLVLIYVLGPFMLFFFVIFFGLTMGGSFILRPLIVANYFGREHIGAITGYMRPFQGLTSAIGPVAVAVAYDAQGSYFWSFVVVMIGYAFTGAVIMLAAPPKIPVEAEEAVPD
jgi:sugar phosphate permease